MQTFVKDKKSAPLRRDEKNHKSTKSILNASTSSPQLFRDQVKDRVNRELHIRGYLRREMIGEGSYAKVWRGTFVYNQSKKLAIKIINKATGGSELVEKFLPRELAILRQIQHPNFVKVYDIFEAVNRVFIVMELAPNGSLLGVVENYGAMSDPYCRRVFRQLIAAVKYLHNKSICHRDLKCENVLIDAEGNAKLTDLGFSRQCKRVAGRPIASDTFCGSLAYVAPEVVSLHAYDPKISDIWSLGCILFVIATAVLPFDDADVNKMLEQQMKRDYCKVPKKILRFIDVDLVRLICRILEPEAAKRATLIEILGHPWMNKKNDTCPECPIEELMASTSEGGDDEPSVFGAGLDESSRQSAADTAEKASLLELVDGSMVGSSQKSNDYPRLRSTQAA